MAQDEMEPSVTAMQPSVGERSLRRTARVKTGRYEISDSLISFSNTAKNNSEFIYYGKYNKELPRPRSFSKNNLNPAADSSESSNGDKVNSNGNRNTGKKSTVVPIINNEQNQGSASITKQKKPKNQRSLAEDPTNQRSQKS